MDLNNVLQHEAEFRYRLLSRMKADCEYYLGYGNRHPKYLWADNEKDQIAYMKAIWESFPEDAKPEWLTMEQINEYEMKMVGEKAPLKDMIDSAAAKAAREQAKPASPEIGR